MENLIFLQSSALVAQAYEKITEIEQIEGCEIPNGYGEIIKSLYDLSLRLAKMVEY